MLRSTIPRAIANTTRMAMSSSSAPTRVIVVGELEVLHDPDKSKFFIPLDDTSNYII